MKGKTVYVVCGPIVISTIRDKMEIVRRGVEVIEQQIEAIEKFRGVPMAIKNFEVVEMKLPDKKTQRYLEKQNVKRGWKNPYRK